MNIKTGTWNVRTMHEHQDRNLERSTMHEHKDRNLERSNHA